MNDEEHKDACEARYWIQYARRYGRQKWEAAKNRMIKKRGTVAVTKLVDLMNEEVKREQAGR